MTHTWIHAESDDFTSCWKWLLPSIIDTAEHYVQCCPPFAAEHHSQCWRVPVEFCVSRLLWCEACTCTLSPPGSPKERNLEMTSLEIGGPQVLSKDCLAVNQKLTWWKRVPLSATCWGRRTLLMHSSDMNRQCFWSKFRLLLIIFPRITGKNKWAFYMNHPIQSVIIYEQFFRLLGARSLSHFPFWQSTHSSSSHTAIIFFGCHWHSFTSFSKIIMLIFLFLEFITLVSDKQIKHYMR